VVIPAGATTATISINPIEDRFRELGDVSGLDNVIVQLLPSPQYNLGGSTSGTVTINDNDGNDFAGRIIHAQSFQRAGDSGDALISVRISANPATNKLPVIVAYRVTGGTAVQGSIISFIGTRLDFVHSLRPIRPISSTRSKMELTSSISQSWDDQVAGGDKTFTVTLFNFSGYTTNVSYVTNG